MRDFEMRELKAVMRAVSETVPEVLGSINEALFKGQDPGRVGEAVADFHRHLVESGIPPDQAYRLTRDYMSSVSIGSMIGGL
ncbi:MAG: hypothetical protein ACOCSO_02140 [Thermoplasmatota archaeon]